MYIPPYFELTDREKIFGFVQANSFGTLVSAAQGMPMATHLPFIPERRGDKMVLISHLALANQQSGLIDGADLLAIFAGPHAYISPEHYNSKNSVPTWNYVAVHCYGKGHELLGREAKIDVLEKMIGFYESAYMEQWRNLSEKYRNGLLEELMAFEVEVTRIEAAEKMNQNKSAEERARIAESLSKSTDTAARDMGRYMSDHQ